MLAVSGFCLVALPLWACWLVAWWYHRIRYGEPPHNRPLATSTPTDERPILALAQMARRPCATSR